MSDIRLLRASDDLPNDADTREARHALLASLLAAYGDGELPAETASQIEAHLAGCVRCRRELAVHHTLRDRLGREPVPAATASLRQRIATGVRLAAPPPAGNSSSLPPHGNTATRALLGRLHDLGRWRVALALSLAVVAMLGITVAERAPAANLPVERVALPQALPQAVPLFAAVLADYRRVVASDLPGRARDLGAVRAAVPFAVTPLLHPELRLLATWTTSLAGEPAAVLAYRWNDRVVLQYLVTERLLFQSAGVRGTLARQRDVSARDGAQGMLLWAQPESGSVLVGELAPAELAALHPRRTGR